MIDCKRDEAEREVAFDLDRAAHAHEPGAEFILQSGDDAFGHCRAKPAFALGCYETESRNSHFTQSGPKAKVCIASVDFDAFRRETIDQYLKSPQFMQACELSESKLLPDGFAFAMVCEQTTAVSVFHFSKDIVSDEMATIIPAARQVQCPRA